MVYRPKSVTPQTEQLQAEGPPIEESKEEVEIDNVSAHKGDDNQEVTQSESTHDEGAPKTSE